MHSVMLLDDQRPSSASWSMHENRVRPVAWHHSHVVLRKNNTYVHALPLCSAIIQPRHNVVHALLDSHLIMTVCFGTFPSQGACISDPRVVRIITGASHLHLSTGVPFVRDRHARGTAFS